MGAVTPLLAALAEKSRRAGWGQAERARFYLLPPMAISQHPSSLPELLLTSIFSRLRGQKISVKGKILKLVFSAAC